MLRVTSLSGFNAGGGPITYVGGKVFTAASGTTTTVLTDLTGGLAAAPAAGDVVVVALSLGTQAAGDVDMTCSGYTELADLYADDTTNANLGGFLKLMTATPDTSITFNDPGGAITTAGAIQVWRGVDPNTIQDVAATTATGISTILANPASITPATPGAIVIAMAGGGNAGAAGDNFTTPDLSGFLTTSGGFSVVGMGWSGPWVSGAVNPGAFGYEAADNAGYAWAAITLALRPT